MSAQLTVLEVHTFDPSGIAQRFVAYLKQRAPLPERFHYYPWGWGAEDYIARVDDPCPRRLM